MGSEPSRSYATALPSKKAQSTALKSSLIGTRARAQCDFIRTTDSFTYMRLFLAVLIVTPALKGETFKGACDGSAVVAAGDGYFLNATDEDNILRLYKLGRPAPVRQFDLSAF